MTGNPVDRAELVLMRANAAWEKSRTLKAPRGRRGAKLRRIRRRVDLMQSAAALVFTEVFCERLVDLGVLVRVTK